MNVITFCLGLQKHMLRTSVLQMPVAVSLQQTTLKYFDQHRWYTMSVFTVLTVQLCDLSRVTLCHPFTYTLVGYLFCIFTSIYSMCNVTESWCRILIYVSLIKSVIMDFCRSELHLGIVLRRIFTVCVSNSNLLGKHYSGQSRKRPMAHIEITQQFIAFETAVYNVQ